MWSIHTVKHDLTMRRNEMASAIAQRRLENNIKSKPDMKEHVLYDSVSIKYPGQADVERQAVDHPWVRLEERNRE